jgi:23S rRNA (cytosine1962-C5)-methyltransferase
MKYPSVVLKKGKEFPVLRNHPWVFSGAIDKLDKGIKEGDLVQILDYKGNYLATAWQHCLKSNFER